MGHVALYRQFRPANFDEIVEQKHAVAALRQSVLSGQIAHAYLFCGTRGTGKTSIAKIFSRAVNCLSPQNGNPCNVCTVCRGILDNTLMDVIEMDAASNNSVDNIRRVCDEVMFLPSVARYKVYIIDEVHMLSAGAFNALLKTLEEPPAHALFLLATTEPHRIPPTIISRCQRYDFRRIPVSSMVERLQFIADDQHISIDEDALYTIANLSDGALRDAISLFDQVSNGITGKITRDDVLLITGVVDDAFLFSFAEALLANDAPRIVTLAEQLVMDGRDIVRFTLDLARYFRDLMVLRVTRDPGRLVQATTDALTHMQILASATSTDTLVYAITRLSALVGELKWSPDMRTSFEIALLSFFPDGCPPAGTPVVTSSSQQTHGKTSSQQDTAASKAAALASQDVPAPAAPIVTPPTISNAVFPGAPVADTPATPVAAPASAPVPVASTQGSTSTPASVEGKRPYMAPPPMDDLTRTVSPPLDTISHSAPITDAIADAFTDAFTPPPVSFSSDTVESTGLLPLQELWATLLHKWEDTHFSDYLQLKQASVTKENHILYIVLPDHMKTYADDLTQRADYKRISKDIQTLITDTTSVLVRTESQRSGITTGKSVPESIASASPAQPEWVEQMLAFSEAAGIPVETLDEL